MAERLTLAAEPRAVLGKKVKQLRRAGKLPGNVFGRGLESLAVELDARDFGRAVKTAGVRSLYDLKVAGESQARPVVLRAISRAGGTGEPIHIDFYQVDPAKPISATVQLRFVGQAPAVTDLAGTLVQSLDSVHVRCYPLAIPDAIEVDLGRLVSFEASLTVGDLAAPEGVEILTDPSVFIASVAPPRIRVEAE
jgi:large subunit ribosomal protein L25